MALLHFSFFLLFVLIAFGSPFSSLLTYDFFKDLSQSPVEIKMSDKHDDNFMPAFDDEGAQSPYHPVAPTPQTAENYWASFPEASAPPAYELPQQGQEMFMSVYAAPSAPPAGQEAEEGAEETDEAQGGVLAPVQQTFAPPVYFPYAQQSLAMKERGWHSDLEEGYLYVKVFRGQCKSGNVLVDLTLHGASKKTSSVSSKVVKKTSAPEFHSEFIFAIPAITGVKGGIALEFKQKKLIGSKAFGAITLPVDQVMRTPPVNRTVDLGASKLDIVTAFAPMSVNQKHFDAKGTKAPAASALSAVRVAMERKVYFAGEKVSGISFVSKY